MHLEEAVSVCLYVIWLLAPSSDKIPSTRLSKSSFSLVEEFTFYPNAGTSFAARTKNVENKPVVHECDVRSLPQSQFSHVSTSVQGVSGPSLAPTAPRFSYGGPRAAQIGLGQPRDSPAGR